jgi:hypothetical protein
VAELAAELGLGPDQPWTSSSSAGAGAALAGPDEDQPESGLAWAALRLPAGLSRSALTESGLGPPTAPEGPGRDSAPMSEYGSLSSSPVSGTEFPAAAPGKSGVGPAGRKAYEKDVPPNGSAAGSRSGSECSGKAGR